MHVEHLGLIESHFIALADAISLDWVKCFTVSKDFCYKHMNYNIPKFHSITTWKKHLNARDKLYFALGSIIWLYQFCRIENQSLWENWRHHITYLSILSQNRVTHVQVEQMDKYICVYLKGFHFSFYIFHFSFFIFHFSFFIFHFSFFIFHFSFYLFLYLI